MVGKKRSAAHEIQNVISKRPCTFQEATAPTLRDFLSTLLRRLLHGEVNIAKMLHQVMARLAQSRTPWFYSPSRDEYVNLVGTIASAIENPSESSLGFLLSHDHLTFVQLVLVDFNAEEYASAAGKAGKPIPFTKSEVITKPAVLVDVRGRIILWFLPNALAPFRSVSGAFFACLNLSLHIQMG